MKIYSSAGSKERLYEMFQRVNKVTINEDKINENIVEDSFNKLKNKQLNVVQTNNTVSNNQNIVEIITIDEEGKKIIFKFRVEGTEGDENDIFYVDNAEMIGFTIKSPNFEMNLVEGMDVLDSFNKKYINDMVDVLGSFIDFSKTATSDDVLYEYAANLIDKIPYSPNNNSTSGKKLGENDWDDEDDTIIDDEYTSKDTQEEDPLALPPDYSEMENPLEDDDDNEVDIDTLVIRPEDIETDDNADPEEQRLYQQAMDNLIERNRTRLNPKYFPTKFEIEREFNKLKNINKPEEPETHGVKSMMAKGKKRVYPAWAERFLTEIEKDINTDKLVIGYFDKANPELKNNLIRKADEMLGEELGIEKYQIPKDKYYTMIRELAERIYREMLKLQNESKESNSNSFAEFQDDREENGEILQGGRGDGRSPLEFKPEQILAGMDIEREHSNDPMVAIEIVLDHLSEDPEYYTHEKHDENKLQDDNGKMENDDEKVTDILLGYKPKNVGNDLNEIIGADGTKSIVNGDDDVKKFQEYEKKDFNSLNDSEKKEYFELWKKLKKDK